MTARQYTIVYIAGYGRSGSTLLERMLAAHPSVVALGEIAYLGDGQEAEAFIDEALPSEKWRDVLQQLENTPEAIEYLRLHQKRHESLFGGMFRMFFGESDAYSQHTKSVFDAIMAAQKPDAQMLIDSSKTARERFFRPFLLARIDQLDVKVIHLMRDARGCLHSALRGSNKSLERGAVRSSPFAGLRACLGWCLANASGLLFALRHGRKAYLQVRYEDLVARPDAALDRIAAFLNLDLQELKDLVAGGMPIPEADQFAGNRVRRQATVTLRSDDQWRTKLSWSYRCLCSLICWPVSLVAGRWR